MLWKLYVVMFINCLEKWLVYGIYLIILDINIILGKIW